jgi:DNA-binding MarR family transcriptional regulator
MAEQRISFMLNSLVRVMNGQADALLRAEYSITYSQFVFLQVLSESGQLDITRLAQALGVSTAAVSKRIDWFAERALVRVDQDPTNAKRVLVSLTAQGADLAKKSADFLERRFLNAVAAAPGVDFAALGDTLATLTTHMEKNKEGEKS